MATKPSLALIPSGVKASKVYSVLPSDGTGDFDFSRSGSATRVNKDGLIETVGSNIPRLNYPMIDGVVSGCPSLLLEPLSRNLIPYSEELDNVGWTKSATGTGVAPIVIANQGLSPDGSLNADRVTFNTSTSADRSRLVETVSGITSGIEYTCSFYIKAWSSSDIGKTIVVRGVGGSAYTSLTLTDNWQRIKSTETSVSTSGTLTIELRGSSGSSVGVVDALIWGAQLEEQSYATSYIPTNGSTVTRVAETCSQTVPDGIIGQTEGTLFFNAKINEQDTFKRISLNDGTYRQSVIIDFTSTNVLRLLVYVASTIVVDIIAVGVDISENNKIAVKYKSGDYAIWVNGVELNTSTSASIPINLSILEFGLDGNQPFYGETKDLRIYNTALSNSELATLTTWKSFSEMARDLLYTIQ